MTEIAGDDEVLERKPDPEPEYYKVAIYFIGGDILYLLLDTKSKNLVRDVTWKSGHVSCYVDDELTGQVHCFHRDNVLRARWEPCTIEQAKKNLASAAWRY